MCAPFQMKLGDLCLLRCVMCKVLKLMDSALNF